MYASPKNKRVASKETDTIQVFGYDDELYFTKFINYIL